MSGRLLAPRTAAAAGRAGGAGGAGVGTGSDLAGVGREFGADLENSKGAGAPGGLGGRACVSGGGVGW